MGIVLSTFSHVLGNFHLSISDLIGRRWCIGANKDRLHNKFIQPTGIKLVTFSMARGPAADDRRWGIEKKR